MESLVESLRAATREVPKGSKIVPARFALVLHPAQDPVVVAAAVRAAVKPLPAKVTPLSTLDPLVLVLELRGRIFVRDQARCFAAAYELTETFGLEAAEPDLAVGFSPDGAPLADVADPEGLDTALPFCFIPEVPALDEKPHWALNSMRIKEAWAFSETEHRPRRGAGVVVAQPDTGITDHPELRGVSRVPGRDVLQDRADATDPMDYLGNKGHGTGTASVLISPESLTMIGAAPAARHMAIRAIESVVRIRQVTVAKAIDWAVDHGAQVITMSLGGLPSFALARAVRRAVQADVIVLAAAGNCVGMVVWPARYDECIAVGGINIDGLPWKGSSRGLAVDVSAPGENVIRAAVLEEAGNGAKPVRQGQGTSFAVALTAGVAALWLAHHGRANVIAAARELGETLQRMFLRLVRATAYQPGVWDPFEMGAGIVDAEALLRAPLDLGRDRESVDRPDDPRALTLRSVKSLVTETAGYSATLDESVDWYRHGPEIAAVLLNRHANAQRPRPPGEEEGGEATETPPAEPSRQLADAVGRPELREALGLEPLPEPEIGLEVLRR